MITSKHDLPPEISRAELTFEHVNRDVIAYAHTGLDLEVYVNTGGLREFDEVYAVETLYDLADRLGSDMIEAYQSGEEL